jgi:glutathione synthase/RimK-type ligase-like ATP-grasp enzyme
MLLILTSEKDLTADFLIVELIARHLPYFRLNGEDLSRADFAFSLDEKGVRREVSIGPRTLNLNAVQAVWYRRAISPVSISSLSPAERAFVAGEFRHLAMGLVLNRDVTWVNPIDNVSVAEHKLYQLRIARQLGFRVPRTIVSRNPVELRNFATANEFGTVCKPIFHGLFIDETASYSIYTRRVTPESINGESVKICPVLLQEEIARSADIRVTIIGSQCFVAEIKGPPSLIDWRDPDVSVSYSASSLSGEVERMCRTMLEKLGLIYGAFDFVRSRDGDLVFLEVNPTGEWAWLENRLEFRMREAFIQLFYNVCK